MVVVLVESDEDAALGAFTAAVDDLLALTFTSLPARDLPHVAARLETQLRRLPVAGHALIAELDRRGVAAEVGARSTAALLVDTLRITPGDAAARVRAARDLGPRTGLTGQPLAPLFARLAAAHAAGTVSPAHARIVTTTIDALPAQVQATHAQRAEQVLTDLAPGLTPGQLAVVARRLSDHLDPDGTRTTLADRHRTRAVTLHHRADGSVHGTVDLDPSCATTVLTVLDALAKPRPAAAGQRDPRSPAQRRHDALHDAFDRVLRAGDLPDTGGTPATVIVTMTVDQLQTRTGLATTAHGGTLPIDQALHLAAEADIVPAILTDIGGVLAYGRTRRTATPRQRIALAARDRGCSFPGCDTPPAWTQAHHITAWADGGPTNLDNLTLVCGFHHREHRRLHWTCHIRNGVPEWTPPPWLDPHQHPQRNHTHHLERLLPADAADGARGPATATDPPQSDAESWQGRHDDGLDLEMAKAV